MMRAARRLLAALALALVALQAVADTPPAAADGCRLVEVFHRDGCPHCARALAFLDGLRDEMPRLAIRDFEISRDPAARERFFALSEAHGVTRPGVPTLLVCGELLVGFDPDASPQRIRSLLRGAPASDGAAAAPDEARIELPLVGTIALADVGLPLFTVAIGLLDGFNPCAMWVLLFLLSLLVHLRSRRRMLLVAGTFVVASGAVYYAFMAAWLNLFLLLGVSQALQVALALLALAIGAVHVKDFVAAGRGVSLSIPGSAKPGLYARVRRVVQAEHVAGSMLLVTVLAVLVNLVELLCTAGLPALYTRILTLQEMSRTAYYGYLALYDLAYVLDDALVVGIAVWTLGGAKLAPDQGRWLKLVSGVTVIALGVLLLVAPGWLF